MIKNVFCAIALVALLAVPAQAGVFGTAFQSSNVTLEVSDTGPMGIFRPAINGEDFTIQSTSSSNSVASASGFGTMANPTLPGLDSPSSYVGPGSNPGDNFFFPFTPGPLSPLAGTNYGFADSNGSGNVFETGTLGSSTPGGFNTSLLTSGEVTAPGQSVNAFAVFGDTSNSIISNGDAYFRFSVEGALDFSHSVANDPTFTVTNQSAFQATISGTQSGNTLLNFQPGELNLTSINGSTSLPSIINPLVSDSVFLNENGSFLFNLSGSVSTNVSQVPEPASLAIFACIGVVALGRRRVA